MVKNADYQEAYNLCDVTVYMQATLPELHAGIGIQHHIDGHTALDHQKQHSGTILATGQADSMKLILRISKRGIPHKG